MTTDASSGTAEASPGGAAPAGASRRKTSPNKASRSLDVKRTIFILLGIALFTLVYFLPEPPPAVDPAGEAFPLSREGRLGLGLFLLAATWWVTEVVPIGVTAITIGVIQGLFMI
ncbi:MAG: hypothetical protein HKO65_08005, partial [Gemmatimonadetes bacterium]|nr:hypothetical protein [Gemmatimonadota bacterium]